MKDKFTNILIGALSGFTIFLCTMTLIPATASTMKIYLAGFIGGALWATIYSIFRLRD